MDGNIEMKLKAENLKLKERIDRLEEELRNCHEALQFASRRADIDFLTGIYNRNGVTHLINGFFSQEKPSTGAICFLDLDNFKQINDRYGHRLGDEVLNRVVQSICRNVTGADVVGRFGGDEFLVLLRDLEDEDVVAGRVEAICQGIREENADYGLTASIGIARYPEDGTTFDTLLEKADRALYQSKKEGKDQIRFFRNA